MAISAHTRIHFLTRALVAGCSTIAFAALSLPLSAQLGEGVRPGPKHQDWQVLCEDTPTGESCFISQAMVDDDGEPVMQVSIGRVNSDPVMVIYLPLGLDLRPGMLFQIGDQMRREFPYQTCLPQGCRVVAPVDTDMLQAMRSGSNFRVGVKTLGSDKVGVIEGSLLGFTAGYTAISK
jgi:invasion protein IalB